MIPPSVVPMGQRAMAAMEQIEFLVVLDAFLTPTARIAHAVLPIASFAETEGTVTNMEGRVQRLRVATNPPGEARTGWQVLAELCGRFTRRLIQFSFRRAPRDRTGGTGIRRGGATDARGRMGRSIA